MMNAFVAGDMRIPILGWGWSSRSRAALASLSLSHPYFYFLDMLHKSMEASTDVLAHQISHGGMILRWSDDIA